MSTVKAFTFYNETSSESSILLLLRLQVKDSSDLFDFQ